ncbi:MULTISPECIES: hypothetical protein [unclassified Mesorhizobium]|uniref:hypothetical protein n=1 Tax=unclassified Mesorhizobium TaxID=325217 RepID=UPI001CCECCF9|nr:MULTISPECIES: hypothetical protein [unclassified Mesorhizobium]MBZ9859362.1 hypothetical protein [Mesorhizobium sp. CA12]MBZ9884450.1 hypothetical protein [Mesorhizobium sp. CA10]
MIFYVCQRSHSYTQACLLLYYRTDLQRIFRLVGYDEIDLLLKLERGTIIWSDMDRLDPTEVANAGQVRDQIDRHRPEIAQLNHPRDSLRRYDLLRMLFDEGINNFRVSRPHPLPESLRYPVFLRDEVGAAYKPPRLLRSITDISSALAELQTLNWASPMLVEFGSRPDADGYYRKYSAYRVGDNSYAQHCFASRDWFIKDPGRGLSGRHLDEHHLFVRTHPHSVELQKVFEMARISYGRIDYAIVEGRIQVFEINTNPTILSYPPTPFDTYDSSPYANMHADALLTLPAALDVASDPRIDESHLKILAELRQRYRKRRRKLTVRKGLKLLKDSLLILKA